MKTYHFSTALNDPTSLIQGKMIRFPSPAKLNLFLYINGKLANGYHELQTLFQFLDYGDWLEISLRDDNEIILSPEIADLKAEDNLIYKAARALQQKSAVKNHRSLGANIYLDKALPMGGGVGGGSSNAATTLVALNYLWNTQLSTQELMEIGVTLGADVPIFIQGQAALAEGIGEKLTPCEPAEKWYVVLKPDVAISTAKIFADPHLPRNTAKKSLSALMAGNYTNDCENIVRQHYPKVDELLNWLAQYAPARLTGTGACVFAEFDNEELAQTVFNQKPKQFQGFVAKGCNQSPLQTFINTLKQHQQFLSSD